MFTLFNIDLSGVPILELILELESLVIVIVLGLAVIAFYFRDTITIGSMSFQNLFRRFLKNRIISGKDIVQRSTYLESYHASTAVLIVKKGSTLTDVMLKSVSARANEFFGKRPESKELIGKNGEDLLKILREWMDPTDYEAFKEDQEIVFKQYGHDQDAFAKVPVVFNGKHPKHPNCVFLPVIVSLGPVEKKNSGESEQWIQIDYLDVERFVPVVEEYKKKMSHPTSPSPQ